MLSRAGGVWPAGNTWTRIGRRRRRKPREAGGERHGGAGGDQILQQLLICGVQFVYTPTGGGKFAIVPYAAAFPALKGQSAKVRDCSLDLGAQISLGNLQSLYLGRASHDTGGLIARLRHAVLCSVNKVGRTLQQIH